MEFTYLEKANYTAAFLNKVSCTVVSHKYFLLKSTVLLCKKQAVYITFFYYIMFVHF